jgi:hypothetical protein
MYALTALIRMIKERKFGIPDVHCGEFQDYVLWDLELCGPVDRHPSAKLYSLIRKDDNVDWICRICSETSDVCRILAKVNLNRGDHLGNMDLSGER